MTLITFPTRVHFSDGVLEESLRAEMESRGHRRALSVCEAHLSKAEITEHLYASLPRRTHHNALFISPEDTRYDTARKVTASMNDAVPDVVVAFGSARAIAHGRKVQHVLCESSATASASNTCIDLIAVPGVDGLPNPCRSAFKSSRLLGNASKRSGLPDVIICDPTIIHDTTQEELSSAAVDAFARCLEAFLSDGYNPPADGMAIDGLIRMVRQLRDEVNNLSIITHREMMAAGINAALAQQKGIGTTQLLGDLLREPHGNRFLPGALSRVLLPETLKGRVLDREQRDRLSRLLAFSKDDDIEQDVSNLLDKLPFARRLSELGLTQQDISRASSEFEDATICTGGPLQPGAMSIMQAAY